MNEEFEMQPNQCSKCNAMSSKWNILLNLTANYQEMLLSKELILFDRGDLSRHKELQEWLIEC